MPRRPICLLLFALLTGPLLANTAHAQTGEGTKTYIPTREEWIAVLFNSSYQMDEMDAYGFRIKYVCPPGEETVVIHVTHHAGVNREAMNGSVDLAKKMILAYSKSRGWDRWLRTDAKYVKVEAPQLAAAAPAPAAGIEKGELKDALKEALKEAMQDLREPDKETPKSEPVDEEESDLLP